MHLGGRIDWTPLWAPTNGMRRCRAVVTWLGSGLGRQERRVKYCRGYPSTVGHTFGAYRHGRSGPTDSIILRGVCRRRAWARLPRLCLFCLISFGMHSMLSSLVSAPFEAEARSLISVFDILRTFDSNCVPFRAFFDCLWVLYRARFSTEQ